MKDSQLGDIPEIIKTTMPAECRSSFSGFHNWWRYIQYVSRTDYVGYLLGDEICLSCGLTKDKKSSSLTRSNKI